MSCPDPVVLSQLADGELPASEARVAASHAAECGRCGRWLERAQRMLQALSDAAGRDDAASPAQRNASCPSPTALAGFCSKALPSAERSTVGAHLESCDACLSDVLAATRLLARLDHGPRLRVPDELRARVAATWSDGASAVKLSEIVVRVTRAAAQLVESRLIEPLRELVELPMPVPATRATAEVKPLSFRLSAESALITATVVAAGEGVGLTLAIEDDAGGVLADQRVFFRRHGRSIYSARTDATGTLRVPSLERGVYEVSCPGVGTTFRLDLRS